MWVEIETTPEIMSLIVEKGSICIDGISLTVACVGNTGFGVSVIPHTGEETTLLKKKQGSLVNLENDIIGKYVRKLMGLESEQKNDTQSSGITMEFLEEYGF